MLLALLRNRGVIAPDSSFQRDFGLTPECVKLPVRWARAPGQRGRQNRLFRTRLDSPVVLLQGEPTRCSRCFESCLLRLTVRGHARDTSGQRESKTIVLRCSNRYRHYSLVSHHCICSRRADVRTGASRSVVIADQWKGHTPRGTARWRIDSAPTFVIFKYRFSGTGCVIAITNCTAHVWDQPLSFACRKNSDARARIFADVRLPVVSAEDSEGVRECRIRVSQHDG